MKSLMDRLRKKKTAKMESKSPKSYRNDSLRGFRLSLASVAKVNGRFYDFHILRPGIPE